MSSSDVKSTSEKSETEGKTNHGEKVMVKPVGFTMEVSDDITDDEAEARDVEEFDRIVKLWFPNGFKDREDEHDAGVVKRKIKAGSSLETSENVSHKENGSGARSSGDNHQGSLGVIEGLEDHQPKHQTNEQQQQQQQGQQQQEQQQPMQQKQQQQKFQATSNDKTAKNKKSNRQSIGWVVVARLKQRCQNCKEFIIPGHRIVNTEVGWAHIKCYEGSLHSVSSKPVRLLPSNEYITERLPQLLGIPKYLAKLLDIEGSNDAGV